MKKQNIEHVDLRGICRESDLVEVTVALDDCYGDREVWITLGQASLQEHSRKKSWTLIARMDAVDFEHDSAYAISLPLVGLTLDHVFYNRCSFIAWVDPDIEMEFSPSFHVPTSSDYDPRKLPETFVDESYSHPVIPEEYWMPPFNKELYKKVRGKRVRITFGPVRKKND